MGVDGGAYILSALTTMGYSNEQGFPRPPLAPGYLLSPFIYYFGFDIGYKVWSAIFSIPPIFATYYLSRIWLHKKHSLFVALFVGVDMSLMEMMVTGSLPLLSLSLLIVVITVTIKSYNLTISNWTAGSIITVCIPLICITNQTSFAILLYTLPVLMIALSSINFEKTEIAPLMPKDLLIRTPDGKWKRPNIIQKCLAYAFDWFIRRNKYFVGAVGTPLQLLPQILFFILGLLISMFFINYYINPEIKELIYPGKTLYLAPLWDSAYWFNLPIGLTVAILGYKKTKSRSLKALCILLLIITIITPILSYNESIINITYRSRYLQWMLIYPILAYLIFYKLWPFINNLKYTNTFTLFFYPFIRKVKYFALVIIFMIAAYESVETFKGQTRYSDQISPSTIKALSISNEKIIASNFSQAHWLSAIFKIKAYQSQKPEPKKRIPHRWSITPSLKHQKENTAINCLYGIIEGCNLQAAKNYLGADYILINNNDSLSDPQLKEKFNNLNNNIWLSKVFTENNTTLYKINLDN